MTSQAATIIRCGRVAACVQKKFTIWIGLLQCLVQFIRMWHWEEGRGQSLLSVVALFLLHTLDSLTTSLQFKLLNRTYVLKLFYVSFLVIDACLSAIMYVICLL